MLTCYAGTQQLNDGLPDAAARDLLATSAIVEELLSPKLTVLPAVDELLYFLEGRPRVRLPAMDVTVAQILAAQEAIDVRDWIERDSRSGAHTLGGLVSASVRWYDVFRTGRVCSEQVTGLAVKELLLGPMLMLDALRPPAQQLRLQFDRDSGDGASGITQASGTARPLRADTLLRASDCWRTLLKGEDKLEGNLGGAVKDLVRKMQVWDDAWYGELPYVLTYAAAGKRVGLYAVTRDDVDMRRLPRAVTRTYDMTDPSERLRLFCVAIQLYRILEAVNAALPPVVPPMDIPLVAESESRGTDGRPLWVPAP